MGRNVHRILHDCSIHKCYHGVIEQSKDTIILDYELTQKNRESNGDDDEDLHFGTDSQISDEVEHNRSGTPVDGSTINDGLLLPSGEHKGQEEFPSNASGASNDAVDFLDRPSYAYKLPWRERLKAIYSTDLDFSSHAKSDKIISPLEIQRTGKDSGKSWTPLENCGSLTNTFFPRNEFAELNHDSSMNVAGECRHLLSGHLETADDCYEQNIDFPKTDQNVMRSGVMQKTLNDTMSQKFSEWNIGKGSTNEEFDEPNSHVASEVSRNKLRWDLSNLTIEGKPKVNGYVSDLGAKSKFFSTENNVHIKHNRSCDSDDRMLESAKNQMIKETLNVSDQDVTGYNVMFDQNMISSDVDHPQKMRYRNDLNLEEYNFPNAVSNYQLNQTASLIKKVSFIETELGKEEPLLEQKITREDESDMEIDFCLDAPTDLQENARMKVSFGEAWKDSEQVVGLAATSDCATPVLVNRDHHLPSFGINGTLNPTAGNVTKDDDQRSEEPESCPWGNGGHDEKGKDSGSWRTKIRTHIYPKELSNEKNGSQSDTPNSLLEKYKKFRSTNVNPMQSLNVNCYAMTAPTKSKFGSSFVEKPSQRFVHEEKYQNSMKLGTNQPSWRKCLTKPKQIKSINRDVDASTKENSAFLRKSRSLEANASASQPTVIKPDIARNENQIWENYKKIWKTKIGFLAKDNQKIMKTSGFNQGWNTNARYQNRNAENSRTQALQEGYHRLTEQVKSRNEGYDMEDGNQIHQKQSNEDITSSTDRAESVRNFFDISHRRRQQRLSRRRSKTWNRKSQNHFDGALWSNEAQNDGIAADIEYASRDFTQNLDGQDPSWFHQHFLQNEHEPSYPNSFAERREFAAKETQNSAKRNGSRKQQTNENWNSFNFDNDSNQDQSEFGLVDHYPANSSQRSATYGGHDTFQFCNDLSPTEPKSTNPVNYEANITHYDYAEQHSDDAKPPCREHEHAQLTSEDQEHEYSNIDDSICFYEGEDIYGTDHDHVHSNMEQITSPGYPTQWHIGRNYKNYYGGLPMDLDVQNELDAEVARAMAEAEVAQPGAGRRWEDDSFNEQMKTDEELAEELQLREIMEFSRFTPERQRERQLSPVPVRPSPRPFAHRRVVGRRINDTIQRLAQARQQTSPRYGGRRGRTISETHPWYAGDESSDALPRGWFAPEDLDLDDYEAVLALTEMVGDAEQQVSLQDSEFPRFKLEEKHLSLEKFSDCRICWDDYEVGNVVTTLPCSHGFHDRCISKWLKDKSTCPLCRQIV